MNTVQRTSIQLLAGKGKIIGQQQNGIGGKGGALEDAAFIAPSTEQVGATVPTRLVLAGTVQPNVGDRRTLGQPLHRRIGQIGPSRRRGEAHGVGFPATGRGGAVLSGQPPPSSTVGITRDRNRPAVGKHPGHPLHLLPQHGALGPRRLPHGGRQQQVGHRGQRQGPVGQPDGGDATAGDQALRGKGQGGGDRPKDCSCTAPAGRDSSRTTPAAAGGQQEVDPQQRDGGPDGPEEEDGPDRAEEASKQGSEGWRFMMMQGRHGVCLCRYWSWQGSKSNVRSTELGAHVVMVSSCLQTGKVLVTLGQAAGVVAQVRVVDVQHHPLDVPAVAAVHGHGLLGPRGRLRRRRGGCANRGMMLLLMV